MKTDLEELCNNATALRYAILKVAKYLKKARTSLDVKVQPLHPDLPNEGDLPDCKYSTVSKLVENRDGSVTIDMVNV